MNFPITSTRIGVLIYAQDVDTLLTQYSHIRVMRALSGSGPFVDMTAAAAEAAELTASLGPYLLNDRIINLLVNEKEARYDYQFTTVDPVSAGDAATELNSLGGGTLLDCYDDSASLVLRTVQTGPGAAIAIEGGDACPSIQLLPHDAGFGKGEDIALVSGTYLYQFIDLHGSLDYAYRYYFYNPAPYRESEPYDLVPNLEVVLDPALLTVGRAHVIGMDGRAAFGSVAEIANLFVPASISGRLVTTNLQKSIDRNGDVWFPLIKGSKVEFWVSGTQLHRTITVPTNVGEFDLLDPSLVADDPFGVVVPPYTGLPRTTL